MIKTVRLAWALMWLACGPAMAAEALVATVVRGDVQRAERALHVLDELQPGDELRLHAGATAVVWWPRSNQRIALAGPGRFRLDAGGTTTLTATGSAYALPPAARQAGALPPAETMAGAIMRAGDDAHAAGAGVVDRIAPAHPYVEWPRRAHAGTWTLRLRDAAGTLLHEATTAENRYVLPPTVPLQPGQQYLAEVIWVSAVRGEQMEVFAVATLDQAADRHIAALRRGPDAPLGERIAYAQVLAQYGLNALARWICPEAADDRLR